MPPTIVPLMLIAFEPDAFIRIRRSAVQPVTGDPNRLTEYMQLPVEQYCAIPLPLRAKLTLASVVWPQRRASNEFALRVPPLTFAIPGMPLEVEPLVYATVDSQLDSVTIASDECTLSGSAFVQKLRLNECFEFRVRTVLTWDGDVGSVGGDLVAGDRGGEAHRLYANTTLDADVETPRFFSLLPRAFLERIASLAMSLVLDSLQKTFLRNLAADYAQWSSDAQYRASRQTADQ